MTSSGRPPTKLTPPTHTCSTTATRTRESSQHSADANAVAGSSVITDARMPSVSLSFSAFSCSLISSRAAHIAHRFAPQAHGGAHRRCANRRRRRAFASESQIVALSTPVRLRHCPSSGKNRRAGKLNSKLCALYLTK